MQRQFADAAGIWVPEKPKRALQVVHSLESGQQIPREDAQREREKNGRGKKKNDILKGPTRGSGVPSNAMLLAVPEKAHPGVLETAQGTGEKPT